MNTVLLNSVFTRCKLFPAFVCMQSAKQGRVESPWPPGTPGSSCSLLLGEAGAPTWPPAFLFQSLWKLIEAGNQEVAIWKFTQHMQESLSKLCSCISLELLPALLKKKKKKALWSSEKCPRPAQPAQFCVVVWQPALLLLSFSWNAVLVENLGCLRLSKTFIWLILGVFSFFCE